MLKVNAWHGGFAAALVVAAVCIVRFVQGAQVPAYAAVDDPRAGAFQISVNVDLVVLHAAVTDRKGRFASDLRAGDFAVYEDGVRQTLQLFRHEDTPAAVGLVIDHSGSMRGKLADVIGAARTFVQSSSPDDQMLVVNFSDTVSLGLRPPIRLSNRPDELAAAILRAPVAGQTALYDAVFRAFDEVRTADLDKKVLVVFSDGGDNVSKHKLSEVLSVAEQSSTLVYAVGIFDESDPDQNPGVLRRLAQATGGEAFFPARIDEVAAIYARIASDIRNQYTLGYVSRALGKAGTHRNIRVTAGSARDSKLTVRTRTGYVVGGGK
jgi:Ca-activated chloride channel family protein